MNAKKKKKNRGNKRKKTQRRQCKLALLFIIIICQSAYVPLSYDVQEKRLQGDHTLQRKLRKIAVSLWLKIEKNRQNSHLINHFPMSEGVSEVSEQVSAAEGASEASSPEQGNK